MVCSQTVSSQGQPDSRAGVGCFPEVADVGAAVVVVVAVEAAAGVVGGVVACLLVWGRRWI